jgi:hypothetical protein
VTSTRTKRRLYVSLCLRCCVFCFPSPWPRGWLAPRRSSYHHHLVSSLRRLQWGVLWLVGARGG